MAEMELRRLEELAVRASRSGQMAFSRFLEPSMESACRSAANRCGCAVDFWGGYPDAERRVACFYGDAPPAPEDWPIAVVRLTWNGKFAHPEHRDLLGALMGLGIERQTTGDVALGERRGAPCAYVFVVPEMADYVAANLDSAGRASLRAELCPDAPDILPPRGETLRLTVQNERLDAVLAAGWRLSRSEAQRLIAGGLVKLNHEICLRPDRHLAEGDLISARGFGRLRLEEIQGVSRRGRQVISVFRFGGK